MPCNVSVRGALQSTPSVGRATKNPLSVVYLGCISIHALRGESDGSRKSSSGRRLNFNPRSPWGERPKVPSTPSLALSYFNPRPPRGGRLCSAQTDRLNHANFNPRPPRGGRPLKFWARIRPETNFNPRPPRGGRPRGSGRCRRPADFNPRPPRGERRS